MTVPSEDFSQPVRVLFSLIKSFLPIPDEAPDWSAVNTADQHDPFDELLQLQDSSIPPDTPSGRQSFPDLNVTLRSGVYVNIEMQNYAQKYFADRMLDYLIRIYCRQPKRGHLGKLSRATHWHSPISACLAAHTISARQPTNGIILRVSQRLSVLPAGRAIK